MKDIEARVEGLIEQWESNLESGNVGGTAKDVLWSCLVELKLLIFEGANSND